MRERETTCFPYDDNDKKKTVSRIANVPISYDRDIRSCFINGPKILQESRSRLCLRCVSRIVRGTYVRDDRRLDILFIKIAKNRENARATRGPIHTPAGRYTLELNVLRMLQERGCTEIEIRVYFGRCCLKVKSLDATGAFLPDVRRRRDVEVRVRARDRISGR